jgi:hypothetical protein
MRTLPRLFCGSSTAHEALATITGWAPSQRHVITGMMAVSISQAIPSVSTAATVDVSPWMSALIFEHQRKEEIFDAVDVIEAADSEAWSDALDGQRPALTALVNYRPRTPIIAKFAALGQEIPDDDGYIVQRLVGDARALLGDSA